MVGGPLRDNHWKHQIRDTFNLLDSIAHRHSTVGHTEVRGNRTLATDTTGCSSLGTGLAAEDADLENTSNLLDLARKSIDLPDAAGTRAVETAIDISLDHHGWEGRVNDEEVLIGLQVTLLGVGVRADGRVDGAELDQLIEDAESGDGGDFDGDVLPVAEKARLELAGVCGVGLVS